MKSLKKNNSMVKNYGGRRRIKKGRKGVGRMIGRRKVNIPKLITKPPFYILYICMDINISLYFILKKLIGIETKFKDDICNC